MRFAGFFIVLLLICIAAGCGSANVSRGLADDEAGQIYGAAIRQIYHVDHSFGQPPNWPMVYVLTTTDDAVMLDAPTAAAQKLSTEVQYAIETELAGESFQLIWAESLEDAPADPANGQIAQGEGIVISLGNIHQQDDGTVQLPFFMTCGGLCGIGKTYVLQMTAGIWQVTGSVGPEIMS